MKKSTKSNYELEIVNAIFDNLFILLLCSAKFTLDVEKKYIYINIYYLYSNVILKYDFLSIIVTVFVKMYE